MKKEITLVEVTRSFSFKLNLGNYQMAEFFACQKEETTKSQAIKTSERLFQFCKDEVEKSVHNYQMENLKVPETKPEIKSGDKKFPTKEESAALDSKVEQVISEGITDQEKHTAGEREFFNEPPEEK